MKRAIVFGATGQMGYYLVELLKSKDYFVVCPKKRDFDFQNLSTWDLRTLLETEQPDEVYNMAGINSAQDSWHLQTKYLQVNGTAVLQILILLQACCRNVKFFQAGSAEVFEKALVQQAEDTNRLPENPYGVAKMMAMELVRIYREKYGIFACTGIFFNAESPRRDKFFFAEKVASEAARLGRIFAECKNKKIFQAYQQIEMGRLDARRDWGWAPEYVEVAWRMLQQEKPEDFVIGTGEVHTCLEFVKEALTIAGLPDVEKDFDKYVKYDKKEEFKGNCMRAMPHKAEQLLGWKAQYKFKDVVRMLVEAEMKVESTVGR